MQAHKDAFGNNTSKDVPVPLGSLLFWDPPLTVGRGSLTDTENHRLMMRRKPLENIRRSPVHDKASLTMTQHLDDWKEGFRH